MASDVLAEALLRIEHKLDRILDFLGFSTTYTYPMNVQCHTCPLCNELVQYQVDIQKNVAVRRCGCKSGMQPMSIPLTIPPIPANTPSQMNGDQAGALYELLTSKEKK